MKTQSATTAEPTVIRMPGALRAFLKQRAVENHRTLSSEVIHRLEQGRKSEEASERPTAHDEPERINTGVPQ